MSFILDFPLQYREKLEQKILSAFGLAKRAGKCVTGTEMCVQCIREKKAKLVIAAGDLSDNTVKRIKDSCLYHNVECIFLTADKMKLGSRLGIKNGTACAAVNDEGFVEICKKAYTEIRKESMEVQQ